MAKIYARSLPTFFSSSEFQTMTNRNMDRWTEAIIKDLCLGPEKSVPGGNRYVECHCFKTTATANEVNSSTSPGEFS